MPQEDRTRSVTHAMVLLLLLGIMACRGTRPVTNTHPAPQSTLTPAPHVDTTARQRPVPAPPAVVAAAPSRPYHLPAIPMTAADAKLAAVRRRRFDLGAAWRGVKSAPYAAFGLVEAAWTVIAVRRWRNVARKPAA